MSENCIFCKIISDEIPSYTVYEDEYFKAILDINPCANGHTILIAKQHVENVYALSEEVAKQSYCSIKKVASALKNAFNTEGLNVLQNNGKEAGQTVPHFHIHLIPRHHNDSIDFTQQILSCTANEFSIIKDKIGECL